MEGAEITLERLDYVTQRAASGGMLRDQVFCAFLGEAPREDFIPYVADFFLQLEDVKWTIIAGIVNDSLIVSVRNLGYSRNAGEFVQALLRRHRQRRRPSRDGQGGRADASASAQKFGDLPAPAITARIAEMAEQFLHEPATEKKKEPVAKVAVRARSAPSPGSGQRLIEIGDQIFGVLQPDRQPHHPLRHAGAARAPLRCAPLRGQDRQAAQALDAAEAGGALDDLQPIEEPRGAIVAAAEIDDRPCRRSRSSAARAIA